LNRWKIGAAAALLVGLALTIGVVLYVGAGGLVRAIAAIGWGGFLLYTAYNLLVFAPLGLAWWAVAPGAPARQAMAFPWGRLLREAASDVLPFSQVGGLVVGVRAVEQQGVGEALVVASLVVDLTTEMAAQLFYTLFGASMLAALLSHATGAADLFWISLLALLVGMVLLGVFVALQGRSIDLVGALVGRWLKDTKARAEAVHLELKRIYAARGRLLAGFLLHALGWVLSGVGSWMALLFMGARIQLWEVLTLESLVAAVKSVGFMTPGALGFQESAYVLIGPLFGLGAESALALSLIKRAKDLVIGAPALLIWQVGEGRRLVLKR
jgi:putative membrane protein